MMMMMTMMMMMMLMMMRRIGRRRMMPLPIIWGASLRQGVGTSRTTYAGQREEYLNMKVRPIFLR